MFWRARQSDPCAGVLRQFAGGTAPARPALIPHPYDMTASSSKMVEEKTPTQARQGEKGKHILWVLAISTTAAVVLAAVGYFYILAQPAEDLAQPVPEVSQLQ